LTQLSFSFGGADLSGMTGGLLGCGADLSGMTGGLLGLGTGLGLCQGAKVFPGFRVVEPEPAAVPA
jgi:hypothetical protein